MDVRGKQMAINSIKLFDSEILEEPFMPYDLYLDVDDEDDIDILIDNINNFNHWCASRVLSLNRNMQKNC